jgi:hypothetical protein
MSAIEKVPLGAVDSRRPGRIQDCHRCHNRSVRTAQFATSVGSARGFVLCALMRRILLCVSGPVRALREQANETMGQPDHEMLTESICFTTDS